MESVLRMRVGTSRYTSIPCNTDEDDDDVAVDFSNAVLYIGALQTIAATVLTSAVSILSCVAMPGNIVSAVRTLVLSSIIGVSVVRKPFRLGRVHGLNLIFRALQPCIFIYICSEVAEQLVHTCTRDSPAPSWRRLVFHSMTTVMVFSGFMRARRPLLQTDLPFLMTMLSLFVVAMLPPPAIILSGPLCSAPTFGTAAERIVRAFVFSMLYSVFVYAAAPPVQSSQEVIICVMRASAASIWVLGAHTIVLPLAAVQGSVVIYVRIFGAEYALDDDHSPLKTGVESKLRTSEDFDLEGGGGSDDGLRDASSSSGCTTTSERPVGAIAASGVSDLIVPNFRMIGARGLVDIGGISCGGGFGAPSSCTNYSSGFGNLNIAEVAARLEAEESSGQSGPKRVAGADDAAM